MTVEPAGLINLRTAQRQLDADGTEVGVSRQALEETFAYIDELRAAPPARGRITHTYSTTDIAIFGAFIYAVDFSHDTGTFEVPERVVNVLDKDHVRKFGAFEGEVG